MKWENPNKIIYPSKPSEFEVQATLFSKLKDEGIDVRGEVKATTIDFDVYCRCRFDLVIFDRLRRAVAIIECKDNGVGDKHGVLFTRECRQSRRYSNFEVPVFQCLCLEHIPKVIKAVVSLLSEVAFA